jgi:hypothetical protein
MRRAHTMETRQFTGGHGPLSDGAGLSPTASAPVSSRAMRPPWRSPSFLVHCRLLSPVREYWGRRSLHGIMGCSSDHPAAETIRTSRTGPGRPRAYSGTAPRGVRRPIRAPRRSPASVGLEPLRSVNWENSHVNYAVAKARGLRLGGSGGAFRSAVDACTQVPTPPYPGRSGRPGDTRRVGQPARQRGSDPHYLPSLLAAVSRCRQLSGA